LAGFVISGVGFALAKVFLFFDASIRERDEFVCLLSFQNCGYLPLILVSVLFAADIRAELTSAVLLFMQGFNLIFWTFGVQWLIPVKDGGPRRYELKKIWNPPFISLLLSMGIVGVNAQGLIPDSALRSIALVGDCTLPVALIILGAVLAECWGPMSRAVRRFMLKAIIGKLVVFPLLLLAFVFIAHPPRILALLLLIEAAMPSAINLSVVSLHQGAGCGMISRAVLWTHVVGIVSIPLFWALMNLAVPY
jgi:Predicted permeases